jgi:hypothetical protein
VREVGNDECVWYAAVLVEYDKIGNVVRSACLGQLLYDIVSSVYPM